MKLYKNKTILYVMVGCMVLAAVGLAVESIENLRIRLECYPSGVVKTELSAKLADIAEDGSISAHGVVLKRFTPDGKVDVKVDAVTCAVDQENQTASSTNHVVLTRNDIVVSGDGFVWNGQDNKIEITKKARVEFPAAIIEQEGVLKNVRKK